MIKLKNFSTELTYLIVKELIEDIGKISEIMMTSKGRDKIFSMMQYTIELYVKCMNTSAIYGSDVKMGIIDSVRKAKIVKRNISSGRKVFKFLKFIDEYNMLKLLVRKQLKEKEKKTESLKSGKR